MIRLVVGLIVASSLGAPAMGQGAPPAGGVGPGAGFVGQWSAQPGGPARVEIRVVGREIVWRQLIVTPTGRCGIEGKGAVSATPTLTYRGRCENGRTTQSTRCRLALQGRDRLIATCGGQRSTLHRARA